MKQTYINQSLYKAYNIFQNDITTITTITDGDFISVTDFTNLLNTILDKKCLQPAHINNLLLHNKLIIKSKNNNQNKFIASDKITKFYKEIILSNYKFYTWDARLLFSLLNINLNEQVTKNTVSQLHNVLHNYIFLKLNKAIIYDHLKMLQLILIYDGFLHIK